MLNVTKTIAAIGVAATFATGAVAQSGPVDSKGQAGSVQQFDNRVTQGTNSQDAADSRARMRSMESGGGAASSPDTTGSVGATGPGASPDSAGGPGNSSSSTPQSKTR